MFGGPVGAGRDEVGEKVASFPTYEKAQKAVSSLIAGEVPARDIAIVGSGLRSIERITGRLGYATAARSGALNGLMLGLLFAFIFVLGTPTAQISAFLGVLLVGMALGMLLSLGTYAIVRRRRDFASVMQVTADHYDVCVAAGASPRRAEFSGPWAPPDRRGPSGRGGYRPAALRRAGAESGCVLADGPPAAAGPVASGRRRAAPVRREGRSAEHSARRTAGSDAP